jgi:hypothetical protein
VSRRKPLLPEQCYSDSGRLRWEGRKKRRTKMEGQLIVALAVAIPIILFPAAFIWYLNIGGIVAAVKEARARKVTQEKAEKATVKA